MSPLRFQSRPPRRTVSIVGTGSYVPERVLTNAELEKSVDTTQDWILSRTGIHERRIAADGEWTSHLADKAARRALEQARVRPEEIDLIILATITPDTYMPSTACRLQHRLGANKAACFDITAACSGFLYGIEIAQQFIANHTYNTVLVVAADRLSSVVNWQDRNTCVLFGDGAGAAILRYRANSHGVISTYMGSNGEQTGILEIPGGACALPVTPENYSQNLHKITMNGREVYKHAVTMMLKAAHQALDQSGLSMSDIACIIPHQANMRIVEALADRLRVPMDKFYINLDRYGNTSGAAVAIALDEASRTGRIKSGDYILTVVFGGGLTYASLVIQW